jgi:hypothetical protein
VVSRDRPVGLKRGERLKIGPLVASVVAFAARRQHLDDDRGIGRGLIVVGWMLGRAADDRPTGITAPCARGDPEPLVGRVVTAASRHPDDNQPRDLACDGVVLIRTAGHRDDHAIDEFVTTIAVLLRRQVVGVRRTMRQSKHRFHLDHATMIGVDTKHRLVRRQCGELSPRASPGLARASAAPRAARGSARARSCRAGST